MNQSTGKGARLIALLLGAFIVCGLILLYHAHTTNTYIEARAQQTEREQREFDKKIQAAKEAARQKEVRRQEAAKVIAEKAASGDASAEGIDSRQCAMTHTHTNPNDVHVVVNKKHCIQPLLYEPSDLTVLNGTILRKEASEAFGRMSVAAQQAGLPFTVTSSYRSYADQVSTYRHWVATSGQEAADTYSARPGYSEHQTGLVVDVAAPGCMLDCFGATEHYVWLAKHAASFGFIQRYHKGSEMITGYKAEEWHYRYVGVKTAQDMQAKDIKTLEEYFNVPGGSY